MNLPKGKLGFARLSAKGAAAAIVLTDGKPPAEFQIFAAGVNESDYGPITFDDIAAAMVMQNQEEKGNPLFFDFNHGMTVQYATAEQGKSGGTFDIAVRGGALLATDCQFTEEAFDRIAKREYNLFSPWFRTLTDDAGVCRPLQLLNVALLNLAGLNGLQPLAAGARLETGDQNMNPIKCMACGNPIPGMSGEGEAACGGCFRGAQKMSAVDFPQVQATIRANALALGIKPGADHSEQPALVTGLMSLRRDLHKATGQDSDAGAIGVIEGWKEKSAQAEGVIAAAAKTAADALTTELGVVLDDGVKAGKVSPAQREIFEAAALAKGGGKASKEGILYLRAKLDTLPKLVSTEATGQKKDPVQIPAVAGVVAAQMGIKRDDYELFRTDRAAWEAKQLEKKTQPVGRR